MKRNVLIAKEIPANIYMFKAKNRNNRKRCETVLNILGNFVDKGLVVVELKYMLFFISHTFVSNARLKLAKH